MVSTQFLENFVSQSFHIAHAKWSWWGFDPYYFVFFRSKVKVTRVTWKKVTNHFLKNFLSQNFHILTHTSVQTCSCYLITNPLKYWAYELGLPHAIGTHIVFSSFVCISDRLSVCPSFRMSICPSRFCVRFISFEPLVGFKNNSAQKSSMMSRCAVLMFEQGQFMVKVIVQS